MVQDSRGRGSGADDTSNALGGFDALFLADSLDESRQLYAPRMIPQLHRRIRCDR